MSTRDLPLADPGREKMAVEIFPVNISPDEYAAREGHRWGSFSFDEYRYSDVVLTEWIQQLGNILFRRNGSPSVEELRAKLLSPQEVKTIEAEIRSRNDDL